MPIDADRASPACSPLFVSDLAGLPPATVVTVGFDVLRDEGRGYAERLIEAGVAVLHLEYPSLIHGSINLDGVIEHAHSAPRDITDALRWFLLKITTTQGSTGLMWSQTPKLKPVANAPVQQDRNGGEENKHVAD